MPGWSRSAVRQIRAGSVESESATSRALLTLAAIARAVASSTLSHVSMPSSSTTPMWSGPRPSTASASSAVVIPYIWTSTG